MNVRALQLPRGRRALQQPSGISEIFTSPQWSLAYAAFIYYLGSIITLRFPGADIAIVTALVFLAFNFHQLRVGRALTLLAVWIAWLWICALVSDWPSSAIDQSWLMTKIWIVAFVGYNVCVSRANVRLLLVAIVFFFLIYPVRGALLNYASGYTVFGRALWNQAYSNPNDLACFALLFGSCALAAWTMVRNKLVRFALVCSIALMLILILLTQSRGVFLATGIVLAIGLIPRIKNIKLVISALALIVTAVVLTPSDVWNRIGGLTSASLEGGMAGVDAEGSAEQRYQIAVVGTHIAGEHLAFGVGPGQYANAHAIKSAEMRDELPLASGNRDAHNTYIETTAESGFIGLVLFLFLALQPLRLASARLRSQFHEDRAAVSALALGTLGVLLAGFFASNQYLNVLHLVLVIIDSLFVIQLGSRVRTARGGFQRSLRPRREAAPAFPR